MPSKKKSSNLITMTKQAFTKEHKKLIKLLNVGKKFIEEAKEQSKELRKYTRKNKK